MFEPNKEKLTGPEMMLKSVLKALGINPQELIEGFNVIIPAVKGGLEFTVASLKRIEEEQKQQRIMLEALCEQLKIQLPEASATKSNGVLTGEILPPSN